MLLRKGRGRGWLSVGGAPGHWALCVEEMSWPQSVPWSWELRPRWGAELEAGKQERGRWRARHRHRRRTAFPLGSGRGASGPDRTMGEACVTRGGETFRNIGDSVLQASRLK